MIIGTNYEIRYGLLTKFWGDYTGSLGESQEENRWMEEKKESPGEIDETPRDSQLLSLHTRELLRGDYSRGEGESQGENGRKFEKVDLTLGEFD